MSHHVVVRVPDGREAVADYRLPIVKVMRRINRRIGTDAKNGPADLRDKQRVTEWLDTSPEQACTMEDIARNTCRHGADGW
jgi:hypothetical protein